MPKQGEHNKWIALALCILLGYLGLHRFYEGKIATGILWLCFALVDYLESVLLLMLF